MLKVLEQQSDLVNQAIGADTVLRVCGPLIERRVEGLVRSIIAAESEKLPELRGRLSEVWHFLTELRLLAEKKQSVEETFNKMFERQ